MLEVALRNLSQKQLIQKESSPPAGRDPSTEICMPAGIRLFNYAKCALSKFSSKAAVLSVPFKLTTESFAEMLEP